MKGINVGSYPRNGLILWIEFRDMETFIAILAIILGITGIIGSVAPGLPGPPISWVGMLLLFIWGGGTKGGEPMSLTLLLVMLAVTIVVTVLDYVVPAYFTKKTGGSKYGSWGSVIGLVVGMFFYPPFGMIIGTMLGAFAAELLFSGKNAEDSLNSAWGAFLGFLSGTGIKLAATGVMMFYIIAYGF